MTSTTYYNLNIVEGTDIVNPLVVDNPNYQKIDETMHDNAVSGVTLATEIANATVHAITRENSECAVIRFIATSNWKAGDTATVDGVPVTALLPSGETLPDGAYVINANVLCILTGTNLTIYAERKKAENANEIAYNDTTVGAELVKLDNEIVNVNSNVSQLLDINTYSTTEKEIGVWCDGSKLYRKSYKSKNVSIPGYYVIDNEIKNSNIKLISAIGTVTESVAQVDYSVPFADGNNDIRLYCTENGLCLYNNAGWTISEINIIATYIKK